MTLFKQPLFQFLVLGSLIFAIDYWVVGRGDDPRQILIDDNRYAEIAGIYRDNQGSDPSEAEMSDLVISWAQNEVLYREAMLMGLDKGDEMIRQRLILKLRNVLFNRLSAPSVTEAELMAWFEKNRVRYDQPTSYDFVQFKVGGPEATETAEQLSRRLGTDEPGSEWQDQIRHYESRPTKNLELIFGVEDAAALIADQSDHWHAVSSPAGWHLARITKRIPGEKADFTAIRSQVGEDWKTEASQIELANALKGIADRYDIRVEVTTLPEHWGSSRIEVAMETPK